MLISKPIPLLNQFREAVAFLHLPGYTPCPRGRHKEGDSDKPAPETGRFIFLFGCGICPLGPFDDCPSSEDVPNSWSDLNGGINARELLEADFGQD